MEPENVIVFSRRSFWIIKGTIAVLVLIIFSGWTFYHDREIKTKIETESYQRHREEFMERYPTVIWEMQGKTYCYEPRNNRRMEAVSKGNGVYKVK